MTCGVDATINCTNSKGVKPPKLIVISSPVEIVASATMGVGATGSAWTVARAGGGTVDVAGTVVVTAGLVVVAGMVVVVGVVVVGAAVVGAAVVGVAVVGADVSGADVSGADVSGADVSGADEGPNESAQFSPGAQDLKLKLKKTPIICPGAGAVSTKTLTMRYLLANAFNRG